MLTDVLVIGAGLSGLVTGWQASSRKHNTRVISKGWGATHWHSGCIDVLGYFPANAPAPVDSPAEGVQRLIGDNPNHPYAMCGLDTLNEALEAFKSLCSQALYPLHGTLERNWLLPSAVGTARPTCLAPETMIAGDLRRRDPMLIVGFEGFGDFYPGLAADNLNIQGTLARDFSLDLDSLRRRRLVNSVVLASMFETSEFRAEVAAGIKPHLGDAARVGLPAVLGVKDADHVKRDLEEQLGVEVFEIPILPPSIPGMRLHHILVGAIEGGGGRVFDGMHAIASDTEERVVTTVWTEAAARRKPNRARAFVLATGGILGEGISADFDGRVREVIFDLPVSMPANRTNWFRQDFLDPEGHPIFSTGLEIDTSCRPVCATGQPVYDNLYAVGTTLAHCEVIRERSFEGVALATGYLAGNLVGGS